MWIHVQHNLAKICIFQLPENKHTPAAAEFNSVVHLFIRCLVFSSLCFVLTDSLGGSYNIYKEDLHIPLPQINNTVDSYTWNILRVWENLSDIIQTNFVQKQKLISLGQVKEIHHYSSQMNIYFYIAWRIMNFAIFNAGMRHPFLLSIYLIWRNDLKWVQERQCNIYIISIISIIS